MGAIIVVLIIWLLYNNIRRIHRRKEGRDRRFKTIKITASGTSVVDAKIIFRVIVWFKMWVMKRDSAILSRPLTIAGREK